MPRTDRRRAAVAPALAVGLALAALALGGPLHGQTVRGHLLDAGSGRPIDLGLVMLWTEEGDSVTYTVSQQDGYFSLTSARPGGFRLVGAALGYEEASAGVFDLGMGGEITVEFRLATQPLPIDEMLVSLERPVREHALVRNGFVRRLQRGLGIHVTPHDIEESPASATEDLLAGLPGLFVGPIRSRGGRPLDHVGDHVQMRSPTGLRCTPGVWLDGVRVRYAPGEGASLSTLAPLSTVEAVEVYRSPSEVPIEYAAMAAHGGGSAPEGACGILLIWTR